jgi:HD-like signal output (HDOD) protein/CheY-like chemotaxis protein
LHNVIFVDDEASILSALRRSLYAYRDRWDMRFVGSAQEAVESMQERPADVVVADFRMPGMDGGQLLKVVRERWPDTARLMLSGHTEEDDLLQMITVAQRFLDKPCDRNVLVDAIESALRTRATLEGTDLRAEIGALSMLPSAAETLDQLQLVLDRRDATVNDVAAIVQSDIGLTVKVVQLANSALFGGSGGYSTVQGALERLGVQTIRSVALMHGLAEPVRTSGRLRTDWLSRLNASAVLTAQLAVRLVKDEEADAAICAALLGESGQLVFAACRPEEFEQMLDTPALTDPHQRERVHFGMSHARAGAYLLDLWGFPSPVVGAVATHDQPPQSDQWPFVSIPDAIRIARLRAAERHRSICLPTKSMTTTANDDGTAVAVSAGRDSR